jgi:hypothetical protein
LLHSIYRVDVLARKTYREREDLVPSAPTSRRQFLPKPRAERRRSAHDRLSRFLRRYTDKVLQPLGPLPFRQIVRDFEGSELADIDAAIVEALEDVRMLMSDAVRDGRDLAGRRVEIVDGSGSLLATVPYANALVRDD